MMLRAIGWSAWAILPIFALAFHFGPGQLLLNRDLAIAQMSGARAAEAEANRLQTVAYAAQFETLAAREALHQQDSDTNREQLAQLLAAEQAAYAEASDAWKSAAGLYEQVETLMEGSAEANQVRLLRGRSLVRAGEVFNGIEALQATLTDTLADAMSHPAGGKARAASASAELVMAAREELAAAHYYGARLLREEGRSADVWRQVSETSRQQFRYLAEQTAEQTPEQTDELTPEQTAEQTAERKAGQAVDKKAGDQQAEMAQNLQRNVERVLDLEQQDRSELVGRPIPKDSPRARRPGDGEPSKRPGKGRRPGEQPGNGATGMMEIGDGW